jgi:hypothetical protein
VDEAGFVFFEGIFGVIFSPSAIAIRSVRRDMPSRFSRRAMPARETAISGDTVVFPVHEMHRVFNF